MWITFTRDWRGYEKGQTRNVSAPTARSALAVEAAVNGRVDRQSKVETATTGPAENTAERTGSPRPRYTGYGWWEVGDRKVQAPEGADPEEVLKKARED